MNFASRSVCRKCGGPRILDWQCACGDLNFSSRTQCRRCGEPKPVIEQPAPKKDDICLLL